MAPRERIEKVTVLEVYRLRWQIEFLFKRLKSLLASGNSLLVRNLWLAPSFSPASWRLH